MPPVIVNGLLPNGLPPNPTVPNTLNVQCGISGGVGNLILPGLPSGFQTQMAGYKGPTPGSITVPVGGVDVSLAQLTVLGGLCTVQNVDGANWVDLGIHDVTHNTYSPMIELWPGESYTFRLSRKLGEEYVGTGTGGGSTALRIRANKASCDVIVSAYDG